VNTRPWLSAILPLEKPPTCTRKVEYRRPLRGV
jgi:hypothetical protein